MTIHTVDIHQVTHTCPANPDPHAIDTRRILVHTAPGGPCRTPVTIRCGDTIAIIACGQHEPATRQCGACRVTVVERTITTQHIGPASVHRSPIPTGYAPNPCAMCRRPLAAVLSDHGRHLLCHPTGSEGRPA